MSVTPRLAGRVSEPIWSASSIDSISRDLREVLAENDRLLLRNKALKRRLDAALVQVADLEASSQRLFFNAPEPAPSALTIGRLCINYDLRMLELDGKTAHVTQRGMELLGYLMSRPDKVIQTRSLANVLSMPSGNAVRQLIWRTRPYLAAIGAESYLRSYGRTWSGGGYWMTARHEQEGQP